MSEFLIKALNMTWFPALNQSKSGDERGRDQAETDNNNIHEKSAVLGVVLV